MVSNKNPLYLSPTRGAVKVLKDDGFENATTVASFLNNPEIEKNIVLIIDESSLVSANVGHKLMYLAKENKARIIFVGDRRQHLSVEAGDFLKVLEFYSDIKNFELSQIIRQIPKHYRKAVQLMANNRTAEGLERLNDGRTIPADFESISYGYATTSLKSQGSTCDHAILAVAQMTNRACYVGSSRGRQSVKVFCPDFEHLHSSVKRNSEHLTGHDLLAKRQEYVNDISPKINIEKEEEPLYEKEFNKLF